VKTPRIATNPSGRAAAKPKTVEDPARKTFSKVLENRRGKGKPSAGSETAEGQRTSFQIRRQVGEEPVIAKLPLPLSSGPGSIG
jgi:hypothetical protein